MRSPNTTLFPEHWDFPGGKLEPGEDPVSGVEREVLEETSLTVRALKVVGTVDQHLDKNMQEPSHRFIVYLTTVLSGSVQLSAEHTAYRWATMDAILQLRVQPCIESYFSDLVQ